MPADSKIVHAAALEAKRLCLQILATDADLQQLKADWIALVATPFASWKASGDGPDAGSLIPPDFDVKMNAVIAEHDTLKNAIIAHLNFLKEAE